MAQTTQQPRAETEDVFHSRLYAGLIGSGKSVTIGHDIRTLLDADEEYRIIDIVGVPGYDRQGLAEEFGMFCDTDDAGRPQADLGEGLREQAYLRVDAEPGPLADEEAAQRIRHAVEHASAAAKESEHPTVVALDALPRGVDQETLIEYVAKARSWGMAIWIIDHEPFGSGLAEQWSNSTGEIVLHSAPKDPDAKRAANLSDADREHVSTLGTWGDDGNPVLVGRPGDWTHEWVPAPNEHTETGGN